MNKPIRNAGIAAIVYILTVMWVVQDALIGVGVRLVLAIAFLYIVGGVYLFTDKD